MKEQEDNKRRRQALTLAPLPVRGTGIVAGRAAPLLVLRIGSLWLRFAAVESVESFLATLAVLPPAPASVVALYSLASFFASTLTSAFAPSFFRTMLTCLPMPVF